MASGGAGWGGLVGAPSPLPHGAPLLAFRLRGPPVPRYGGIRTDLSARRGRASSRLAAAAARIVATRSSLPPFAPRAAAAAHLALRRSGLRPCARPGGAEASPHSRLV